MRKGQELGLV